MTNEAPALAVDGGAPLWQRPYPDAPVVVSDGRGSARELEAAFAAHLGVAPFGVVAFGSHEAAYDAALAAAGVPDWAGREVIVPAVRGDALAAAAVRAGASVVPGEVEADIGTLSSRGIVRALSETPGTTAAITVGHTFGHPAGMNELLGVAAERGLPVIEDCSDAVGATYRKTPLGRFGVAAVFALGDGHILSPEGAALLVVPDPAHEAAAERARLADGAGLDDARAAQALVELRGLDAALEVRRQLAWELTFNMRTMRGMVWMQHSRWVHHAYDRYVIRLRALLWKRSIEDTVAAIRAEGIPCEIACPPSLHLDPAVRAPLGSDERLDDAHFAAAARLPQEWIAIPLHAGLTSKDMDDLAQVLRKVERWST